MDYVNPREVVSEAIAAARRKASLPARDLVLRGALAGVLLGYATSLAMVILAQGLPPVLAAALFPVGFVMLVLLGFELATGNFALLPAGLVAGEVRVASLLRNWAWVYAGNLLGSLFYAVLFYLAITSCGTSNGGPLGDQLRLVAQRKTLAYAAAGLGGWSTAAIKGVLCNWMVTIATMLALVSRSAIGKIAAMWLPIMTFFAHGYEHSIVNMFAIPAGMLLGASVSLKAWWWWNQVPVTLGNVISGALFTGIALYATYAAEREPAESAGAAPKAPAVMVTPSD